MLQKVRHLTHFKNANLIFNVLHIALPKPRWTNRQHETNIKPTPIITYAVVAVTVTTFLQLTPQATLQQFTKAGLTEPLACVIAVVVALVAFANEVVKYSVNTLDLGQQELPFCGTYTTVPCALTVT